ncbi:hypothetical protein TEA_022769 [Camellia sinensis var. sinensis]|uniref:Aldehyde oxidase/xanthine dehydrogenase a/b hammerhead domain-containing protein n=1 Tax=Camellia sinensis var. sinensis TaxID=542762 RepID=A0A4S4EE17_CAMSN|nr:hypothetical protein TEA_022769 [Camellia sinensis var. sinensis]
MEGKSSFTESVSLSRLSVVQSFHRPSVIGSQNYDIIKQGIAVGSPEVHLSARLQAYMCLGLSPCGPRLVIPRSSLRTFKPLFAKPIPPVVDHVLFLNALRMFIAMVWCAEVGEDTVAWACPKSKGVSRACGRGSGFVSLEEGLGDENTIQSCFFLDADLADHLFIHCPVASRLWMFIVGLLGWFGFSRVTGEAEYTDDTPMPPTGLHVTGEAEYTDDTPMPPTGLHVTGEAEYTDDTPMPPTGLHGALILSQKPHARILSINDSGAKSSPGFAGIFFAKDVPGDNMIGPVIFDEELFATEFVTCVG